MKFLIIGGIFTAESAASLIRGLTFNMEAALFGSMPYGGSSSALFAMLSIPFIIIGLISIPFGLSFLITGAVKRNKWLADNAFR
ncbi:MAG: hypothetical protein Q6373_022265 [Candidatus Sigynarchaeota archaeon]